MFSRNKVLSRARIYKNWWIFMVFRWATKFQLNVNRWRSLICAHGFVGSVRAIFHLFLKRRNMVSGVKCVKMREKLPRNEWTRMNLAKMKKNSQNKERKWAEASRHASEWTSLDRTDLITQLPDGNTIAIHAPELAAGALCRQRRTDRHEIRARILVFGLRVAGHHDLLAVTEIG